MHLGRVSVEASWASKVVLKVLIDFLGQFLGHWLVAFFLAVEAVRARLVRISRDGSISVM